MSDTIQTGAIARDADGTSPVWVRLIPRVIGAWILAGALFKLLAGTPAHLPEVVRDLSPLGLQVTYQLVIAIEFVLVVLAFFRPRWAWFWLAGCLAVFVAILASQIAAGKTNCGCFGANFSPNPWVMLAIDGALLGLLLASRPWSQLPRGGAHLVVLLVLGSVLAALPFVYSREATIPSRTTGTAGGSDQVPVQKRNAYVVLDVESMVGQSVDATPFASAIDVFTELPLDGVWVVYRHTCQHCEEHLRLMAERELGNRMIGLVRLVEKIDDDQNRIVYTLPTGPHVLHAEMPDTVEYVIQTPAELLVEGGMIVDAKEGVDPSGGF
ncbi:MAG: MauE/DoxX family redox-associated membrane protein [Planctomycetota bacterium]